MRKSRARCVKRRKASRRFVGFSYRTLHSWSSSRRVVAKAEWLPGPRGYNARFVVTNIPGRQLAGRELYEDLYCARGEMENSSRTGDPFRLQPTLRDCVAPYTHA